MSDTKPYHNQTCAQAAENIHAAIRSLVIGEAFPPRRIQDTLRHINTYVHYFKYDDAGDGVFFRLLVNLVAATAGENAYIPECSLGSRLLGYRSQPRYEGLPGEFRPGYIELSLMERLSRNARFRLLHEATELAAKNTPCHKLVSIVRESISDISNSHAAIRSNNRREANLLASRPDFCDPDLAATAPTPA